MCVRVTLAEHTQGYDYHNARERAEPPSLCQRGAFSLGSVQGALLSLHVCAVRHAVVHHAGLCLLNCGQIMRPMARRRSFWPSVTMG